MAWDKHGFTFCNILIVWLILLPIVKTAPSNMLKTLIDRDWPWFGSSYIKKCSNPRADLSRCFNLRADKQESIVERAGLPSNITLATELQISFTAPKEKVDICGKEELLSEVERFYLNVDGTIANKILYKGGEVYRKKPEVTWEYEPGVMYSLIFWDVGLLRVRGWFYNIYFKDQERKEWLYSPYYPPANPTSSLNPILVILLEQKETKNASLSYDIMKYCVETYPTADLAKNCRDHFIHWINDGLTVIGLQVYYTDGDSIYEKFRACTEGYFCDKECIDKYAKFAKDARKNVTFLDIVDTNLDFYVNLRFTGLRAEDINTPCCGPILLPRFEFRPRPGDNLKVKSVGEVFPKAVRSRIYLEMAGPVGEFKNGLKYFAVLIVNPGAIPPISEKYPYGHMFFANFKYPGVTSTPETRLFQSYVPPHLPNLHRYYILLFSYNAPLDEGRTRIEGKLWKLRDVTEGWTLRSMSWFDAESDEFSLIHIHEMKMDYAHCYYFDVTLESCSKYNNTVKEKDDLLPLPHPPRSTAHVTNSFWGMAIAAWCILVNT